MAGDMNAILDKRLNANKLLHEQDMEVFDAIEAEYVRQNQGIELIASENYVSPAVLVAMGSVLTNKYAEGYPGHRYYGGCQKVDVIETLAIERAKKLFGAETCQCATPFRRPGQYGRLSGRNQTG